MKTENEIKISVEDFKLIKQFYPEFSRKQGIKSNDFIIGWSELMPVVEKIESIGFRTGINYSTANKLHGATIYNAQVDFKDTSSESKIGITYKVVVEFIKWYKFPPHERNRTNPFGNR